MKHLKQEFDKLTIGTDMDADKLTTQGCTIYVPTGDMSKHTADFLNFPKANPEGGFSLICIKEGNWQRQIYMEYNSHNVYVRSNKYVSGGNSFLSWKLIEPQALS